MQLIDTDVISGAIAKKVLTTVLKTGDSPKTVVDQQGLAQISDTGPIVEAIRTVLEANSSQVAQYHGGQTKVMGFLVGQVMRAMGGRAKPDLVNKLLAEELENTRV
ncbi:Aspartyl/glutamyl-tRNA(Asn/Gln) amidotransferase subunit B [compost metagenome]